MTNQNHNSRPSSHFDSPRISWRDLTSAALRLGGCVLFLLAFSYSASTCFAQSEISSSALIGKAMDSQIPLLDAKGGLLDVMKTIESQTGVRLEATQAVWDALPWGQDTTLSIHASNTTLRETIETITHRLGLTYRLGAEAIVLEPSPPLARHAG